MTTTKPPSQWPRTKETTYSPGPPGQKEQTFGGLKVVQLCAEYHCELTLLPAGEDAGPPPMPSSPQFWLDWDDSVWGVLSPTEEDVFLHVGGKASVLRLTDGRYQRVDPTPKSVAARTSPPLAWLGTGLAGLFIVALIHLLRRRLRRRRSALLAARKGTLEADGRVTFEDGSVAQLEGPPALPCGPVLVLGGSAGATYRHNETLSEKDMLTGTVDEHLEELRLRVLRYNAAAACVACLSAAPLVGALLVGLVV
ncbi:MAG: hypothetical protein R3F14_20690 [Polyangiaceae bacterium]